MASWFIETVIDSIFLFSDKPVFFSSALRSAAAQNAEGAQAGTGQKSGKEPAPSRRKEEAKQAVKKPKEKENALSQFDLNNYASECSSCNSV